MYGHLVLFGIVRCLALSPLRNCPLGFGQTSFRSSLQNRPSAGDFLPVDRVSSRVRSRSEMIPDPFSSGTEMDQELALLFL